MRTSACFLALISFATASVSNGQVRSAPAATLELPVLTAPDEPILLPVQAKKDAEPPKKDPVVPPKKDPPPPPPPPERGLLADASTGFGSSDIGAPNMIGDLGIGGYVSNIFVIVGKPIVTTTTSTIFTPTTMTVANGRTGQPVTVTTNTPTTVTTTTVTPNNRSILARVPLVGRAGYKIGENESPRPVDRFFATYNYFSDVHIQGLGQGSGYSREIVGFERTFLDGDASIGMRVPFFQTSGSMFENGLGDLSAILKYAVINNRENGNLVSIGLVATFPTAPNQFTAAGTSTDTTILQPFVGYIANFDRLYFQGFTSIAFPTQSQQPDLFFQSAAFGYRLYENANPNAGLRYVIPVLEGHATLPLQDRGFSNTSTYAFPDIFVVTAGAHFGIFRQANLSVATGVPLTGPKPYDVELIAQLNWRY